MKSRILILFILTSFCAQGQRIFWVERSNNRIMQSNGLTASSPTVFRSGLNAPQHVEVDQPNGYVIFTSNGGESIKRLDLSNGGNEIFLANNGAFVGYSDIAVNGDDGYVYGTEINGGIEYIDVFSGATRDYMNLAGVSDFNFMFGIDYSSSSGDIFYVDADDPAIYGATSPFGNTAFPGFLTGVSYEYLEIDGENNLLYYSDGSQILRSSTGGGSSTVIQSDAGSSISAMAFYDRVGLFYTTSTEIWFYDIHDDTNVLLRSGLSNVRGLAVELDTSAPSVFSFDPTDDAVGVTNGQTQIRITFNEEVQESITSATGTDIQVRIFREGSLWQTIDRSSITFSGNEAQIPTNAMVPGDYYVLVGSNVVSNISRLDYFGISNTTTWNFTVPCDNPTVAPTGGVISNLTSTTADLSWTNGNGDSRIIVLKEGSAVDFAPVDLIDYGGGDTDFGVDDQGGGNFLINNTTANTTSIGSLSPSTTYFYSIIENQFSSGNCYGLALTGSFTTSCEDPTVQALGLGLDGVGSGTISISWTNGNGNNRLILAKEAATFGSTPTPVDGSLYVSSSTFGLGSNIAGSFVVFNGAGSATTVDGLSPLTTYSFAVFEYSDVGGLCYLETISGANTLSQTTLPTPEPLEHISGFGVDGVGLTTIDLLWVESVNAQLAEGYLLQAIADGSSFPAVADGVAQSDDTNLSDGVAVVNLAAGATSYQFTGATPAVDYTFRIYPYTNTGVNIDYKTDGTIPEQMATTLPSLDSDVILTTPFVVGPSVDYTSFQGADVTIGSFLLSSFDIRDGGADNDADMAPTVLTGITFNLSNSANLSRIALYEGTTELSEISAGATATFNSLTVSAPDNGTTTLDVYVTFNTAVTDGVQVQITVANVTSQPGNSGFALADGGGASRTSSPIEVSATAINIVQQPSATANQYVALTQQPIFEAVDINDNVDIDFTEAFVVGTADPDDLIPVSAPAQFISGQLNFLGSGFNFEGVGTSTLHVLTTGGSALLSPNTVAITVSGTAPTITTATPTDDTACAGGDGAITVTAVTPGVLADYTFELFDDASASVSTNGPAFTGLESGDYTVVATNISSGISSVPFAVTVGESLPVIDGVLISATSSVCNGESVDLSVTITGGGDPYELQIDDGSAVSTTNGYISGNPIPVTPTSTTTYTLVSLIDGVGCTGTVNGAVTITVNPLPIVDAIPIANTACNPNNGEFDLSVAGSSGDVTYAITGAQDVNFSGTALETVSNLAPGDYTITVTDNITTCISTPIAVTIDDTSNRPTVNAGSATFLCEGETVALLATPSGGDSNYTFLWDNEGTLDDPAVQNPVASPTTTTTYSVTVTDGLGCVSDAAFVTVTVSPQFQTVTLNSLGATTICEGDQATLTATMIGGTAPYSFMLSDGTSITNYASGSDIPVSPATTTTYSITSIEDNVSCTVQAITGSVTINVDQAPSTSTVGPDDTTCEATYANLGGSSPAVGSGVWTTTGSATIDDPTSPTSGVSNLSFGSNTFTWTITNGTCTQSNAAAITLTRQEPPTGAGSVQGSTELCSDAQNVTYTVAGITGATTYNWTLPSGFAVNDLTTTTPSITVNLENGQAGTVEATASNACGMITAAGLAVSILQAAEVSIIVPNEIKPGQETQFSFNSADVLNTVNWSFGDGGTSTATNSFHTYERTGSYTVELTFENDQGCTGTTSTSLTVVPLETISIKNAVTPNGDGQNDFLMIEGILDYPGNTVTLFDRWGVEVAQFSGYTNDWDLIINGDYIPAGNYICVVELPEIGETVKRSITVIKGD
ncbi:MAG: gliding motility-associated C-terminal domain-containing protein [Bacteroidota bacterium]